jgi:hypothetical protein
MNSSFHHIERLCTTSHINHLEIVDDELAPKIAQLEKERNS